MSGMVRFECCDPILRVENMEASLRFYVDRLGFANAEWGNSDFTNVRRDGAGIYLCRGGQGRGGAWVWVGVDNVDRLRDEIVARGVTIAHGPETYPWAREIHVEDPDGNMLRFGSDPDDD